MFKVADNNAEGQVILLDAKAAFDKVIHSHMDRRVYQAGIDDNHWVLIYQNLWVVWIST
jgi:hypothetical protein